MSLTSNAVPLTRHPHGWCALLFSNLGEGNSERALTHGVGGSVGGQRLFF